jgi:hypothetical protein
MATNPRDTIDQSRSALTSSNLFQFPATQGNYYSRFSFAKYSRSNPKVQTTQVSTTADVILPLPFNLREQYSINYSGSELSWIGAGIETYDQIMSKAGSIAGSNNLDRTIGEQALQGFVRSTFSDTKPVQVLDYLSGTVVNPHLVNLFTSTNLRTHNFTWQLSPTSQAEAVALQNIVKQLRFRMHASRKTNFILGFPDEVYVTFYGSSFLYPVFKSVVQDVQVDYTDGRPNAFFIDGSPVTITLSITLQEVEALTREDFDGEQATTTGNQTTGVTNAS